MDARQKEKHLIRAYRKCEQKVNSPLKLVLAGFHSMKQLGVLLLPWMTGWDASSSQVPPQHFFFQVENSPVPIYNPGWREAL